MCADQLADHAFITESYFEIVLSCGVLSRIGGSYRLSTRVPWNNDVIARRKRPLLPGEFDCEGTACAGDAYGRGCDAHQKQGILLRRYFNT